MTIVITQKIIKIGTSRGVTIPAKQLRELGAAEGDELELVVRKKQSVASDDKVRQTADDILNRYHQDFKNLAER